MYLAEMKKDSVAGPTVGSIERFAFVVEGAVEVKCDSKPITLEANHWAYFPPTVNCNFLPSVVLVWWYLSDYTPSQRARPSSFMATQKTVLSFQQILRCLC